MYQKLNKRPSFQEVKRIGVPAFVGLIICLTIGSNTTAASHKSSAVAIPARAEIEHFLGRVKTGQKPDRLNKVELHPQADTTDKIFTYVEQMPVFPGGEAAQNKFIKMNLRYPAEAMKAGVTGLVVAQFVVNKKGKIKDITVVKSVSKELDEEVMRIAKIMPDFAPAQQNGQPVSFRYTMPVRFSLAVKDLSDAAPDTLHTRIFTFAENPPQFTGGEAALQEFIKINLKHEVADRKRNAQKYVLTQFIIDTNGNLFYPKVIKSAGKNMDEEALRVVKLLPAFIPAKQNGKPVVYKYTLPVRFGPQ